MTCGALSSRAIDAGTHAMTCGAASCDSVGTFNDITSGNKILAPRNSVVPVYTFTGGTDSGMSLEVNDVLRLSALGTNCSMTLDSFGLITLEQHTYCPRGAQIDTILQANGSIASNTGTLACGTHAMQIGPIAATGTVSCGTNSM